jgi:tRNA (guanine-N7-)-methyltransferase
MQDSPVRVGVPSDDLPLHFRRVVSFHPRGGRLNAVQRRAFDAHAERWYSDAHELSGMLDAAGLFGRTAPLALEIGSGMGESTAAMAATRADVNLIAVEVYKPGVAQTLHHLAKQDVPNVRLIRGDGIQVLTEHVAPGSLDELWVFFPDPWPKTRHRKRRLVTPEFTAMAAARLRRGGVLRLATDWQPYAEQMLVVCSGTKGLRNPHAGWAPRPDFRPRTRFERRGLAEGRAIWDLEFIRR